MSSHAINVIHASTVVGVIANQNTNLSIQRKKRTKTDLWIMTMDNKNFNLLEVIGRAIYQIDLDGGFTGNSQTGFRGDDPGYKSTKDKVIGYFEREVRQKLENKVLTEAMTIREYFKKVTDARTDFMLNCVAIANGEDEIPKSKLGFAVAMVPVYRAQMTKNEMAETYANSEYVGVVGKRKNFFIKLLEKKFLRSHDSYIYTFADRRANLIKTWVTPEKDQEWNMNVNDCIDLDGYVRRHEANKYTKIRETYINRVKIIENKGAAS